MKKNFNMKFDTSLLCKVIGYYNTAKNKILAHGFSLHIV